MKETPLCELAAKYGTDKITSGYTPFYHRLFAGSRDLKKVLEIGIGTRATMTHVEDYTPGASLFMWQDYFPAAEIFAIDINADVLVNRGRIQSMQVDQRNFQQLKAVQEWAGSDFDLIVDDGDHAPEAQLSAFKHLFPLLAPGGLYVIEDAAAQEELASRLTDEFKVPFTVVTIHTVIIGRLVLIEKSKG